MENIYQVMEYPQIYYNKININIKKNVMGLFVVIPK